MLIQLAPGIKMGRWKAARGRHVFIDVPRDTSCAGLSRSNGRGRSTASVNLTSISTTNGGASLAIAKAYNLK
jgi:hypothetical protein